MVFARKLFMFGALAASVLAAPSTVQSRTASVYNLPGDPSFRNAESDLSSVISCPTGQSDPKTVLLVPGTVEAADTFYGDNFAKLLPANGFPYCYLLLPSHSLTDAQLTGEYVAYAINSLAASTGNPIRVLAHSQGGLNVQWALTFFPSTRASVHSFFAIGADYRGTITGPIINALEETLYKHGMASIYQQSTGSNFLKALEAHGGLNAQVPTTTIRTRTDDVVQPEFGSNPSSVLAGDNAVNMLLQDLCPTRLDGHFNMVIDSVTQYFALQAFNADNGLADSTALSSEEVSDLCDNFLPQFNSIQGAVNFTESLLETVITLGGAGKNTPESWVTSEPALFDYAL